MWHIECPRERHRAEADLIQRLEPPVNIQRPSAKTYIVSECAGTRVERFVEKVKSWAKRHGIRHKDLAAMIGITPQGITEIFQGRNRPTADQVLALLEIMSKDPQAPKRKGRIGSGD